MQHNLRKAERFSLCAKAELRASGERITGEVVNISMTGVMIRLSDSEASRVDGRKTWVCQIASADLPSDIAFLARVVRKEGGRDGLDIGCEIGAIADRQMVLLKAYRSLAKARVSPLIWKKRLYGTTG